MMSAYDASVQTETARGRTNNVHRLKALHRDVGGGGVVSGDQPCEKQNVAMTKTIGCEPCPNCGGPAAYASGSIYRWWCPAGEMTEGDIADPPTVCTHCGSNQLTKSRQAIRLCSCLRCPKLYNPAVVDWEEPPGYADALAQIASAAVPPGARRR